MKTEPTISPSNTEPGLRPQQNHTRAKQQPHLHCPTIHPATDCPQPAPVDEETEEFDIEEMLIKMEAECRKLEREWMAARYVSPVIKYQRVRHL
jgi:hypothetical protein